MTNNTELAATRMATADVDLGTTKVITNNQPTPATVAVASVKDSGRVRIGGASIRF